MVWMALVSFNSSVWLHNACSKLYTHMYVVHFIELIVLMCINCTDWTWTWACACACACTHASSSSVCQNENDRASEVHCNYDFVITSLLIHHHHRYHRHHPIWIAPHCYSIPVRCKILWKKVNKILRNTAHKKQHRYQPFALPMAKHNLFATLAPLCLWLCLSLLIHKFFCKRVH